MWDKLASKVGAMDSEELTVWFCLALCVLCVLTMAVCVTVGVV